MKKRLSLMLAVAMVLALFVGCGTPAAPGVNETPTELENSTPPPAASGEAEATPAPSEQPSGYKYAKGNYQVDENGVPIEPYEYELPLSTENDVLTFWTVTFAPQYIPEGGFNTLPNVEKERELTGVNTEYIIVSSETRAENMAVLLASDDLPDVLSQALIFMSMPKRQAITDGYLANLYDYRDYMPNYMYYANNLDTNTKNNILGDDGYIYAFYALFDKSYTTMGYLVREDWLNRFNMTHTDITTIDDVHNMLSLFKSQVDGCQWPMEIISSVDVVNFFSCYDTQTQVDTTALPTGYVVNGEVRMPHCGPNDLAFVTTLNQWFSEGLIDPNWSSYLFTAYFDHHVTGGITGFSFMQPAQIPGFESMTNDPGVQWEPVKNPRITEGQTLHLAYGATNLGYGHSCVSAKSENIELAVTWCDWRYSPAGSFFSSYGVEGLTWEMNENGIPMATEFATRNPNAMSYDTILNFYMVNFLAEHGMEIYDRKYAFDGGERFLSMHAYWVDDNNDDAYKWPAAIQFTDDQNSKMAEYSGDAVTYLGENFLAFIDGSKSLAEWDTYTDTLSKLGWEEIRKIKQQAYDDYMASIA